MKLTKLSLVAALLIGSSAFAIENTKVSGDVNLFYGTMDQSYKGSKLDGHGNDVETADMFNKDASYANASLQLDLTTDLSEGVSAGVGLTAVSTLGLENNLVSQTWSNSHGVSGSTGAAYPDGIENHQVDDAAWVDEAWIAGTALDTTVKVGRQALDTPLAFTETWGVDSNTFEAAVLINQSIPDTTLVGAWVGKSNGSADEEATGVTVNALNSAQAGYVAQDGKFSTFAKDGAYAAGIINNSWKPLTAQAWYYDLQGMAKAYWLQADLNIEGVLAGAQYVSVDADTLISGVKEDKAYAVMLGYEMKDTFTIKAAYSSVDDEGTVGVANTATGASGATARNGSGAQSKLYTEMWWNYGAVSQIGADSYSITAEATVGPEINLFAGYYYADIDVSKNSTVNANGKDEATEYVFNVSKSFGPLDTSLALIYDEFDRDGGLSRGELEDVTHLQVYLTYNF